MSGPTLSSQPRRVASGSGGVRAAVVTGAGVIVLSTTSSMQPGLFLAPPLGFHDLVVADWDLYDRNLFWRLWFRWATADTPPAANCSLALMQHTGYTGTVNNITFAAGPEAAGSRSRTFALGAGNTVNPRITGPDFVLPADGIYVPILNTDAAWAAGSAIGFSWGIDVLTR